MLFVMALPEAVLLIIAVGSNAAETEADYFRNSPHCGGILLEEGTEFLIFVRLLPFANPTSKSAVVFDPISGAIVHGRKTEIFFTYAGCINK